MATSSSCDTLISGTEKFRKKWNALFVTIMSNKKHLPLRMSKRNLIGRKGMESLLVNAMHLASRETKRRLFVWPLSTIKLAQEFKYLPHEIPPEYLPDYSPTKRATEVDSDTDFEEDELQDDYDAVVQEAKVQWEELFDKILESECGPFFFQYEKFPIDIMEDLIVNGMYLVMSSRDKLISALINDVTDMTEKLASYGITH